MATTSEQQQDQLSRLLASMDADTAAAVLTDNSTKLVAALASMSVLRLQEVVAEACQFPLATPAHDMDVREAAQAALMRQLAAALPQNPEQARVMAHAALLRFRNANATKRAKHHAHSELDKLGGSVRVQATDLLVAGGMAQTPADKAASNHPLYVEHKAKLAQLALDKSAAEDEATEAYETLQNMREYMRSFSSESMATVAAAMTAAQANMAAPRDASGTPTA